MKVISHLSSNISALNTSLQVHTLLNPIEGENDSILCSTTTLVQCFIKPICHHHSGPKQLLLQHTSWIAYQVTLSMEFPMSSGMPDRWQCKISSQSSPSGVLFMQMCRKGMQTSWQEGYTFYNRLFYRIYRFCKLKFDFYINWIWETCEISTSARLHLG